jgi:3-hydroxyacyl-[acyl-carrier-protein] dehydratase
MSADAEGRSHLGTADIGRIMAMLPHRYPFLLIDRIIDMDRDLSGTGIKNVTVNEPFFQGHFPQAPVMPGVLIVEAMAQTAGALVLSHLGAINSGKLVYFMAIDHARFRKPVLPGDVLHLPVRQLQKRGNVWRFAAEARVEGRKVAEAEISAMLVARPE